MAYLLHESIVWLCKTILNTPKHAKLFLSTCDNDGIIAEQFKKLDLLVSTATAEESEWQKEQDRIGKKSYNESNDHVEAVHCPDITMLSHKRGDFHYAFSFPLGIDAYTFDSEKDEDGNTVLLDKVFPVEREDQLLQWSVSQANLNRMAPISLMLMEQCKMALLGGGYFGMVVPKKWSGTYVQFVNKWMEAMGTVVKIELPPEAIYKFGDPIPGDSRPKKEYAPGKHVLMIFHKTYDASGVRKNTMEFASQRYRAFAAKLKDLTDKSLEGMAERFKRTEWWRYSVRKYAELLRATYHGDYSVSDYQPIPLTTPKNFRILKVAPENQLSFRVVEDKVSIGKNDPMQVRVVPNQNGFKLQAFSSQANAAISTIHFKLGIDTVEQRNATQSGRPAITDFEVMFRTPLRDCQQRLLELLTDNGLTPTMWQNDYNRMIKSNRWLGIQLTPVERTIRVPGEEEGQTEWETIYDDVGLQASYPEVYSMWNERAKRMKLNRMITKDTCWVFPFQYNDIVTMACKQSLTNANVPGLGKTREMLLLALMRCQQRVLIVSPVRLIGIWQQEIETTITNYVRSVRKDWAGNMMRADYQVIKHAEQCLPENLAMFNIISYNDLARVPKDALFFQCPKCQFRICSPMARYRPELMLQPCPRCNHGKKQEDKRRNKEAGFRKYREKGGKVVDERVSTGKIMMQVMEEQFPKVNEKEIATKEYNALTGEMEVKKEVVKSIKKLHLKWTFANLLRNTFSMRIIDEGNNIANADSQRSTANEHCRCRSRFTLTGTPIKGYPQSIINIFNWTNQRSVYPKYRPIAGDQGPATRQFIKEFVTFVKREGKADKPLPKISQPEIFQQQVAPLIIRHIRHEPLVAKSIPPKTPEIRPLTVEMDPQHRKYYERWIEEFAKWWMVKRQEVDKKDAKLTNDLLVKLGYLVNASSIPHFMTENLGSEEGKMWAALIGPYKGPPVAKMNLCFDKIKEYKALGDKVLVFSWRKANVRFGYSWCIDHTKRNPDSPIYPLRITGDDSNDINPNTNRSKKQEIVDNFCNKDYNVLWATTATLKEGFNIPQANRGIFIDCTWEPNDSQQSMGRMLRPGQKKEVTADFLCHRGTVDEYVSALNMLKQRSANEGMDYEAFDDLTADMIPDFVQYANSIVDGTGDVLRTKMWLAVEELRKRLEDLDEDAPPSPDELGDD